MRIPSLRYRGCKIILYIDQPLTSMAPWLTLANQPYTRATAHLFVFNPLLVDTIPHTCNDLPVFKFSQPLFFLRIPSSTNGKFVQSPTHPDHCTDPNTTLLTKLLKRVSCPLCSCVEIVTVHLGRLHNVKNKDASPQGKQGRKAPQGKP